jgi:hypothetical protein
MARGAPLPRPRPARRDSAWTACAAPSRPVLDRANLAPCPVAKAPASGWHRAQKLLAAAPAHRRATAAATARQRMARLVPARVSAPQVLARMGCVARARAMAPACPATRPVGLASALPTPWAATQRVNVAWAATPAASPATVPAAAILRTSERFAGLVQLVTAPVRATTLIRPPAAQAAPEARAELAAPTPVEVAERAAAAVAQVAWVAASAAWVAAADLAALSSAAARVASAAASAAPVDAVARPASASVVQVARPAPSSVAARVASAARVDLAARSPASPARVDMAARLAPSSAARVAAAAARVDVAARVAPAAWRPAARAAASAADRVVPAAVPMAEEVHRWPTRAAPMPEEMRWRPTRAQHHICAVRVATAIWGRRPRHCARDRVRHLDTRRRPHLADPQSALHAVGRL